VRALAVDKGPVRNASASEEYYAPAECREALYCGLFHRGPDVGEYSGLQLDLVRGDHTFEHPYVLPEKEDHQALHAYSFLFLLVLQLPLGGRRY
jgi:hypothetical protein